MKGGVEDRDVGDIWQLQTGLPERFDGRPHVERRKLGQPSELDDDGIVDEYRVAVEGASVNDPVSDTDHVGGNGVERVETPRRFIPYDRQLEARRACVDD